MITVISLSRSLLIFVYRFLSSTHLLLLLSCLAQITLLHFYRSHFWQLFPKQMMFLQSTKRRVGVHESNIEIWIHWHQWDYIGEQSKKKTLHLKYFGNITFLHLCHFSSLFITNPFFSGLQLRDCLKSYHCCQWDLKNYPILEEQLMSK